MMLENWERPYTCLRMLLAGSKDIMWLWHPQTSNCCSNGEEDGSRDMDDANLQHLPHVFFTSGCHSRDKEAVLSRGFSSFGCGDQQQQGLSSCRQQVLLGALHDDGVGGYGTMSPLCDCSPSNPWLYADASLAACVRCAHCTCLLLHSCGAPLLHLQSSGADL